MSARLLDFQAASQRLRPGFSPMELGTIRAMAIAAGAAANLCGGTPGLQRCYVADADAEEFVVYITSSAGLYRVGAYDVTLGSFTNLEEAVVEALMFAREAAADQASPRRAGVGEPVRRPPALA